jgi:exodeoxyribonuclease VIII
MLRSLDIITSIESYHASQAIGNSDLTLINRSIDHYLAKNDEDRSDAMILGQAFHDMILSNHLFHNKFAVIPSTITRKAGKEYELFKEESKGKQMLSGKDMTAITWMRESVLGHPKASLLLNPEYGVAEGSFFYKIDDVKCKCRPDFINTKFKCLVDLKTTRSATPDDFARSVASYRYHVQAAWYLDGVKTAMPDIFEEYNTFLFVTVETKSPYSVCVFELVPEAIAEGRRQYMKDLNKYKDYLANKENLNYFRGISDEILVIQLPTWAYYKDSDLT